MRKGMGKGKGSGWKNMRHDDSKRHSLASRGIKSAQKIPNTIGTFDVKKVDSVPPGFRKIGGNLTSPPGYTWYNNGKSRFSDEYKSVLVKDKPEKFFTKADLKKIERLTDTNDNDTSFVFIAKKIKSPLLKDFQRIKEDNEKAGYNKNYEERYELYNKLRDEFMATHPTEAKEVFRRT